MWRQSTSLQEVGGWGLQSPVGRVSILRYVSEPQGQGVGTRPGHSSPPRWRTHTTSVPGSSRRRVWMILPSLEDHEIGTQLYVVYPPFTRGPSCLRTSPALTAVHKYFSLEHPSRCVVTQDYMTSRVDFCCPLNRVLGK